MEEKTVANEVTSTQKSLSSSHDPGWNDPPKWAFSPTAGNGGPSTKRLLNKRVAFPLNSGSPNLTKDQPAPSLLSASLPPPLQASTLTSAPHRPLCAPTGKPEEPRSEETPVDRTRALDETMENLEAVIKTDLQSSNKLEEIERRLDVLKMMWKEDKLMDAVCVEVLKLSQALRCNDVNAADKIHDLLVMEHAAVCNTWISAIRHMIIELRGKTDQPSQATVQGERSYLLPQTANEDTG